MSTVVKTCEEFTTRRKIRYGGNSNSDTFKSSGFGTLTPSSVNASLSPHKSYYGRDQDDVPCYFIEFNIGDFQFDEITIRTEDHRRLVVHGKSKCSDSDDISREFTRDFTLPSNVDQYSVRAQLEETTRQLTLIGQLTETAIGNINKTTASELKGGSFLESSAALTSAMQSTSISSSKCAYSSSALASSNTSYLKTSTNPSVHYSTTAADVATHNDNINNSTATTERKSNFSSTTKIGTLVETRQTNGIEYEIYLGNELRDGQASLEMVGYNTLIARVIKSDWDKHGDFSLECKRQIKLPYGANPQNSEHGILPSGNLIIKVPYK